MRWLIAIAICMVTTYWVYEKYQLENKYIEMRSPADKELSMTDRALIAFQREYELEIEKDEAILRSYQQGKISFQQYNQYFKEKAKRNISEEAAALDMLSTMMDPEEGIYSGVIKMAQRPSMQKKDQIKELEEKINTILDKSETNGPDKTIALLIAIAWMPVGDEKIDNEMTEHYQTKINRLVEQFKKTTN